jgi:hypothetical protein
MENPTKLGQKMFQNSQNTQVLKISGKFKVWGYDSRFLGKYSVGIIRFPIALGQTLF